MTVSILYILPAALGLLIWLLSVLEIALARWRPTRIGDAPADGPASLPRLSVIVPARNEEKTVAPAMQSLFAVDYPNLEIIAVNDRSTDRTGQILEDLAAGDPRLRVVHVHELPPGWLGKNHALHIAGKAAAGEYLLFTDADVHFEPSVLRKAVRYAVSRHLDHLVVLPHVTVIGFWETLMVWFFSVAFSFKFKPWKVPDPKSEAYMGAGDFNLVRTEFYRRAGGHAALPMDLLDDMKLGKIMKEAGGKAEVAFSGGAVRLRWVVGLAGVVYGLEKNAFAAFSLRALPVVGAVLAALLVVVWPVIGLFVGPGVARSLCAGSLVVMFLIASFSRPDRHTSLLYVVAFPLACVVMCFTVLRSMILTYRQGGVVWRGTLYPLDKLRRGIV
jgi:hypothetical protein